MFYVSYIHGQGYRVRRNFDTREAAQEFIDANALVCRLPGVKLYEIKHSVRANCYIVLRDDITIAVVDTLSAALGTIGGK